MLKFFFNETAELRIGNVLKTVVGSVVALVLVFGSVYTVDEGHVGIIKTFGEAKYQVNPGLHFKVPIIDSVIPIEVRTRKNEEIMISATKEQMPITVIVSVNWTVEKSSALALYKQYGGLDQFENRILDTRFQSATKDAIPKYTAEQLIQDRATATAKIEANLLEEMSGYPVDMDSVQIKDITLPPKYVRSIETKQTEKNLAAAEEHKLAKQALIAQQSVNIDVAKAAGIDALADAEARRIELVGTAEAKAIKAKARALKSNPLIVKLTEAQNWDGKLPTELTIMGKTNALPILDLRK